MKSRRSSASAGVARRKSGWESGGIFDSERHVHSAADAESGQASARFSPEHFVEQGYGDARSGAADGMTERDGATVDVEFFAIKMKLAITCQYLGGECFVEFDEIEVVEFETVFLFELANRRHGADPHDARIDSGRGGGENSRQRLEMVLLDERLTR